MPKTDNNKRALEAYKIFPYIAWSLTIGFSFFVYQIVADLKDVTVELKIQTDILQEKLNANPVEIEDFDALQ